MPRAKKSATTAPMSAKMVRRAAEHIRILTSGIDAIADTMEENGIDEAQVAMMPSLTDGMKSLNRWVGALKNGVTARMDEMGLFGAIPPKEKR